MKESKRSPAMLVGVGLFGAGLLAVGYELLTRKSYGGSLNGSLWRTADLNNPTAADVADATAYNDSVNYVPPVVA